MAKVPYAPVPSVTPAESPTGYLSEGAPAGAFGATVGAAEQQLGGAEEHAGSTIFGAAMQAQDFRNTADARNANIGFMNDASQLYAKYSSLEGQAAYDALPQFQKDMDATIDQHSKTLTSPAAQNDFLNVSRYSAARMIMGAGVYAAQQQKQGWIKTADATIEAEAQFGVVNRNDPNLLYVGEQKARAAAEDTALHLNLQPGSDQSKALIAKTMGRYYRPIIESQAATDPALATATFGRVRDKLDAETQAFLDRSLRANADRGAVAAGAAEVIGGTSAPAQVRGADTNAAWERVLGAEGGEDAQGNARVSPKGASGAAQTLASTAQDTAQKHGVPYHPEALQPGPSYDSSYSKMIGRLYFGDLAEKYGGNMTLTSAAYNAGPGRVDEWLKTYGDPRQGVISDADWASKIPIAETQKYVQTVAQPTTVPHVPGVAQTAAYEGGSAPPLSPGAQAVVQAGRQPAATGAPFTPGMPQAAPGAPAPAHAPQAYTAEQQMVENAWKTAQTRFPGRPDLQREMVNLVYQHIQETNVLQSKFEAEQAKAKADAAEQASNDIVKAMRTANSDPHQLRSAIWDNDALSAAQKSTMAAVAERYYAEIGKPDIDKYGPAYTDVYNGITANSDDPKRISDPSDVWRRAGPGGDLTLTGAETLTTVMARIRKDPDQAQISKTEAYLLDYAKGKLSFQDDTGPVKVRDPNGEQIFKSQLIPMWEKGLSDWLKAGKDPWQYVNKANLDKMMQGLRNPADMARDRLAATGEIAPGQTEPPNAPLPPAPEGANPSEWHSVMGVLPTAATGRPYTHAAWAKVLTMLMQNPEQGVKDFDAKFGAAGFSGQELLDRLKRKAPGALAPEEGGINFMPVP